MTRTDAAGNLAPTHISAKDSQAGNSSDREKDVLMLFRQKISLNVSSVYGPKSKIFAYSILTVQNSPIQQ